MTIETHNGRKVLSHTVIKLHTFKSQSTGELCKEWRTIAYNVTKSRALELIEGLGVRTKRRARIIDSRDVLAWLGDHKGHDLDSAEFIPHYTIAYAGKKLARYAHVEAANAAAAEVFEKTGSIVGIEKTIEQ